MSGEGRQTRERKDGDWTSSPPCTPHEELVTTYSDSASPFAIYYKKGEHRNNVQAWHDYEYYWNAYKVTEPLSITQQ